jgi:uracil-DNA glycosylase family 4
VDAREQLRRYLEQRREMGESELVLDSLTVEEAMRIVGGGEASRSSRPAAEASGGVADWREMLRAASGDPADVAQRGQQPRRAPDVEKPRTNQRIDPPRPPAPRRPDPPRAEPPRFEGPLDAPLGLTVGSDARELFGGPLAHLGSLEEIARVVHECTRCPLYATATNAVPGEGSPQADVMIVGEAPGANEDATGRPFVGPAGQLLSKILAAVNLRREDVFICNVMKHRPPGNRNPTPDEVAACSPYLVRQIEVLKPKVILALGTFAAQTLLATKLSIGKLRGQVHRYHGVPLIVTYHPAALLRNPGWKRPTWEDVQLARRVLDRAAAGA